MSPIKPKNVDAFILKNYPTTPSWENLEKLRIKTARRFGVLKETATLWISEITT